MKIIATNILDFNAWYRYGFKIISKESLINLDDDQLLDKPRDLFNRIGFFEEDGDVFFAGLDEIEDCKNGELFVVPINRILSIIPFSERGGKLLSSKLFETKIDAPIQSEITKVILKERDHYLIQKGGEMILNIFRADNYIDTNLYQSEFIKVMDKYIANLNWEPNNLFENLVFYERSRPYPSTDDGFLFDVGSIAKSYFGISNVDLKNKDELKNRDIYKYECLEQVLSLSIFLQNNIEKGVFSAFIREFQESEGLLKLNHSLSFFGIKGDPINNLLVLAFYLKFRYMVRNTQDLLNSNFYSEVQRFITKQPKEASIAIYLIGLFFGFLKFRELYYRYNPLPISMFKHLPMDNIIPGKIESKKDRKDTRKNDVKRLKKSIVDTTAVDLEVNIESVKLDKFPIGDGTSSKDPGLQSINFQFDNGFRSILLEGLSKFKRVTKLQRELVMSSYDKAVQSGPLSDQNAYFIKSLNKDLKETNRSMKKNDLIEIILKMIHEQFD